MSGISPKQLARIGEFHLEEAILDVLLQPNIKVSAYFRLKSANAPVFFEKAGSSAEGASFADIFKNEDIIGFSGLYIKNIVRE